MSIALSEFWTRLVESGITDADGCKRIAASFCDANGGTPPSEPVSLAKYLIKSGEMTDFQARAILAARGLRFGSYVVRSDSPPAPLSRWVFVQTVGDRRTGFLFRARPEHLSGGRDQWLAVHAEVTCESLQPIEVGSLEQETTVFSELPSGQTLADAKQDSNRSKACEIGVAVADALAALHTRSLIHGAVRLDRVWIGGDGKAFLLRDPSGPPPGPMADDSHGWLDTTESPAAYCAPELAAGGACDQASDIYALGCLIYRSATGRMPFRAGSTNEMLAAHAQETPPELVEAVQKGETGDPLFRVLAFAMAKNPSARFGTAQQFADALRATLPLIADEAPIATPEPDRAASKVEPPPPTSVAASRKKAATGQDSGSAPKSPPAPPKKEPPPKPPRVKAKPSPPPPPTKQQRGGDRVQTKDNKPVSPGAKKEAVSAKPSTKQPKPTGETKTPAVVDSPPVKPPVAPPPASDIEPASAEKAAPLRRRKKKKKRAPLILGALCVPILLMMIFLIVGNNGAPEEEKPRFRPPIPDVIPPVTNRPTNENSGPVNENSGGVTGYELVDDERLLWVPPYGTDSDQAPLNLLPPGPGVIVSARLAQLSQSPIGKEVIDALPELSDLIEKSASRSKVSLQSIQRCSIALHPGKDGWPDVSLAIELTQPQPLSELTEKWNAAQSRTTSGATIYAGDEIDADAYYIAPADIDDQSNVSRFAVGSVAKISEVAENEGGAIPLPVSSQRLWKGTSADADLVLLITPNFLFADARAMLLSTAPELADPLKAVLIPDVAGALMIADVAGNNLYTEVRFVPSGGVSEPALLKRLTETIGGWPDWADGFLLDSVPDTSWRLLGTRLPQMMAFVSSQTRFGVSEGSAVANAYLPSRAVPQVSLALLLALNTPSGQPTTVATAPATKSLTVEEMLNRNMTVSFDQESLEFAINTIVDEFARSLPAGSTMPPVRIVGGDLEKDGITQNQQISNFSKTDLPLRKVLTDLLREANTDKTATGPSDPRQTLVWIVADDPQSPGKKVILVTTRAAVAGNDAYELPQEFVVVPAES